MTRFLLGAAAALTLAAAGARAEGPELNVGDKAPKLEVKEFVKGDPVKEFAKGKVYVVEFWATWCGPCRVSIPHLTKLQKEHKDVTFIGVSVWERDAKKVKPFVEEMGEKMDYRVAMDAVPEDEKKGAGAMAKNWMEAAGQDGIPAAFVVNGDGIVAWIGHPSEMDGPLADVIAGKWDLKAAVVKAKEEKARQKKLEALAKKLQKAQQSGDAKELLSVLDEAIAEDGKFEQNLGRMKFGALQQLGDADKLLDYGRRLVNEVYKDDAVQLNELAWPLVDPDKGKKLDAKLAAVALDAAKRAVELTKEKSSNELDTLACAHFAAGDPAKAVEAQKKALKLKPDDDELKAHLEKFEKALEKKGEK